jgi:GT2 family glycosyltransferase
VFFLTPIEIFEIRRFIFRAGNARNIGIRNAKGNLILFLDSDIIANPNLLEEHWKSHNNSKQIVMGHRIYLKSKDLSEKQLISNFSAIEKMPNLPNRGGYNDLEEGQEWEKMKHYWSLFSTNNLSVKKKDIVDIGLFDKYLVLYGIEDTELGYRFYKRGYKFTYNNNAVGYHMPHKSERANKRLERKCQRMNLDFFYKKHLDSEIIKAFSWCLSPFERFRI